MSRGRVDIRKQSVLWWYALILYSACVSGCHPREISKTNSKAYTCLTLLCLVLVVYLRTVSRSIKPSFPSPHPLSDCKWELFLTRKPKWFSWPFYISFRTLLFFIGMKLKRANYIFRLVHCDSVGEVKCTAQGSLNKTQSILKKENVLFELPPTEQHQWLYQSYRQCQTFIK